MIQCAAHPPHLPGEGRDPFLSWAPAFAGVAGFLYLHLSLIGLDTRVRALAADRRIAALTVATVGSLGSFTRGVAVEHGFIRYENKTGKCGLCNQHSVERIAMWTGRPPAACPCSTVI